MWRLFVLALVVTCCAEKVLDSTDSSCSFVDVDGRGNGKALLQVHGRMSEVLSITEVGGQTPKSVGVTAPLDEAGYAEVRATCCNAEMLKFGRRIIIDENLELCSKWGLMGLVPWFTCDQEKSAAGLLQRSALSRIRDVGITNELAPLPNSQLLKKAVSLGVDEEKLEEAEDSDNLHEALIGLILDAQGHSREKEAEHLASLRMSELHHMVKSLGLENTKLEEAEDSPNRKAAYIDLILASKGHSTSTLKLTYAGLREAILASQPPRKCAFVAPIDSCTTGENLGPDCHGVYGFNDFTDCPAGSTTQTASTSAPATGTPTTQASTTAAATTTILTTTLTTKAPSTVAPTTTTLTTTLTTKAPSTAAPTTTTLTTTPGTPEWVLVNAKANCQGVTNPAGVSAMLTAIGKPGGVQGAEFTSLEICQNAAQLVLEDTSQTACANQLQYLAGECYCFAPGSQPCQEWQSSDVVPDDPTVGPNIWRYMVICAEKSVSGDCLSCIDGFHLDVGVCKSTYLHGAFSWPASTSACIAGYDKISSAAECTKAAIILGLSITAATEISTPLTQAGCSYPVQATTDKTDRMDILGTEVFFNSWGDTSEAKMATICKATAAP